MKTNKMVNASPNMKDLVMISGDIKKSVTLSFNINGVIHHINFKINRADKEYAERIFAGLVEKIIEDRKSGVDIWSSEYLSQKHHQQ